MKIRSKCSHVSIGGDGGSLEVRKECCFRIPFVRYALVLLTAVMINPLCGLAVKGGVDINMSRD
jgi:hypothetical protein